MFRLALLLFVIIGASTAGILIVAALVAGLDTQTPIIIASALGFALAVPISYLVASKLA
ncbi:CTP synthetase [Tropicimonas sp. IMCC6043]|uniref:CTP synthetase n=1 Tax=Tropicimonas sp. IMCC6043 TaxID=2510645 RepID=UPI00101C8C9A|nr:CTP synthetase [Tropicimonas sp. IMCC6043]RYH09473.1 CTP synthetase [Tropicimonas sp. IMCC6043]